MTRLTWNDGGSSWGLEDCPWASLSVGQKITEDVWEELHAALAKLRDYEDTGYEPEELRDLNDPGEEPGETYCADCQIQWEDDGR